MPDVAEPLFAGAPTIPAAEVFERARRSNPPEFQLLARAYEQFVKRPENAGIYADPTAGGATVQQMWLFFTLFRIEPYCVLVRPLPAESTQRIGRLVTCTPRQLIEMLESIQKADGEIVVMLAYHDGTTGHCITIKAYDAVRDRFIYHDPWPERSLLAKENNAADVDARQEGERRWSVTAAELERVAFAAFVFPDQWAKIQGRYVGLSYEEWKQSDFFQFFHLKQLDEGTGNGRTIRVFAPGPFKETIALLVECVESGRIVRAALRMRSDWVIDNFMMTLDLTKSFVLCFAPSPDRGVYEEIAGAFWSLRDPRALMRAKDADPDASDGMRCVHAFMGSLEDAGVSTDFASLSVRRVTNDDRTWQAIDFLRL